MIWQMIKKQLLIFKRRPSQLQLLIGMPILFIGILGLALGGFVSDDPSPGSTIEMNLALLDHGDEEEQVERFIHDVEQSGMPSEELEQIKQNARELAPVHLLEKTVLNEMGNALHVEKRSISQKEKILKEDDYAVVLEIPEQFTYETLEQIFLDIDDRPPSIKIYQNREHALKSSAFQKIMEAFQEQLTLMSFVNEHGMAQDVLDVGTEMIASETETVSLGNSINATEYYAIGMAMAYVLFVATLTGFWAYYEKKAHVFNRVITSDISRWTYLFGIFLAGTIMAFIHLIVVYTLALLLYGIIFPDILSFLLVTLSVSLAVGGLAAILAAISYRLDSQVITNLFASFVIYILAFVGGSFFPVGEYSGIIQMIGNMTPNGAGMTAYLTIMRGGNAGDVLTLVMSLVLFGGIMLMGAYACFPKRGGEI